MSTSVLASLHWLPVHLRNEFKILLIVFKKFHGLVPAYLSELLRVHTPLKALRSSNQVLLDVPRTRLKNKGVRPGSIDPMKAVVQRVKAFCVLLSFLFHDTTRLNGTLFLIYFISLFHLTP